MLEDYKMLLKMYFNLSERVDTLKKEVEELTALKAEIEWQYEKICNKFNIPIWREDAEEKLSD